MNAKKEKFHEERKRITITTNIVQNLIRSQFEYNEIKSDTKSNKNTSITQDGK
jgi:hypothetical protein